MTKTIKETTLIKVFQFRSEGKILWCVCSEQTSSFGDEPGAYQPLVPEAAASTFAFGEDFEVRLSELKSVQIVLEDPYVH